LKKLLILLLLFTSLAYADINGATGNGVNITGCKKLSNWYFCSKFYGNYVQAVTEATLCQSANNGDAARVTSHYTNPPPGQPRVHYYGIWWAKCLEFEYGASYGGFALAQEIAAELGPMFDNPVSVSELVENEDSTVTVYVVDSESESVYSTLWDAEGALLDMVIIDPESDEQLIELTTEDGLAYYRLTE